MFITSVKVLKNEAFLITEKKKVDVLTSAENDELTIILELNQILTLLNAKIIAFNDDY